MKFDKVEFAHRPEEKDEIDLGSLTVWVSGRSGSNEPDFFRESEEKALPRLKLAGERSRAHIDHVLLEVRDVAAQRRRICTLTVAVSTAQGKATADAVEIQLDAGKVAPITWGQAPALTAEPAPPPSVAQSPCFFTAERAAKALGQPMLPDRSHRTAGEVLLSEDRDRRRGDDGDRRSRGLASGNDDADRTKGRVDVDGGHRVTRCRRRGRAKSSRGVLAMNFSSPPRRVALSLAIVNTIVRYWTRTSGEL